MWKYLIILTIPLLLLYSCNDGLNKDEATKILKEKVGYRLPFKEVKITPIENGTGVIVDKFWCFWIDKNKKVYCVNGSAKSIYQMDNPDCKDAPIKETFSDINEVAK